MISSIATFKYVSWRPLIVDINAIYWWCRSLPMLSCHNDTNDKECSQRYPINFAEVENCTHESINWYDVKHFTTSNTVYINILSHHCTAVSDSFKQKLRRCELQCAIRNTWAYIIIGKQLISKFLLATWKEDTLHIVIIGIKFEEPIMP